MRRIDLIINNEHYRKYITSIEALEVDRVFCRHGMDHGIDVARIAYIINLENELGFDKELIYAISLLHDIGRYFEYTTKEDHRSAGVRIAREILASCDFSEEEIEKICMAISAHKRQSEDNKDTLEYLIYKADKLSRNCFSCGAYDECYWDESNKNKGIRV